MAILVQDSFNRANSTSLGTTDTGQSWEILKGSFQIIDNQASVVSNTGEQFAVTESGTSDGKVSVYLYHGDANGYQSKLTFRALDSNNIFFIDHSPSSSSTSGNFRLLLKRNGSYTSIATTTAGEFPSPYLTKVKITVELSGTEIKWYINDTLARTVTNSFFTTHTKHGIGGERNTGRIDDLLIEDLSTVGEEPPLTISKSALITGTATVIATKAKVLVRSASIQGVAAVTANDNKIISKTVAIATNATVTATTGVVETRSASASISARATVRVAKTKVMAKTVAVVSRATVTAMQIINQAKTAAIQAVAQVHANGNKIVFASASIIGTVRINTAAVPPLIETVRLEGERKVTLHLFGSRELNVNLLGSRDLTVSLRGDV